MEKMQQKLLTMCSLLPLTHLVGGRAGALDWEGTVGTEQRE